MGKRPAKDHPAGATLNVAAGRAHFWGSRASDFWAALLFRGARLATAGSRGLKLLPGTVAWSSCLRLAYTDRCQRSVHSGRVMKSASGRRGFPLQDCFMCFALRHSRRSARLMHCRPRAFARVARVFWFKARQDPHDRVMMSNTAGKIQRDIMRASDVTHGNPTESL